jgi:hypothetical protein
MVARQNREIALGAITGGDRKLVRRLADVVLICFTIGSSC